MDGLDFAILVNKIGNIIINASTSWDWRHIQGDVMQKIIVCRIYILIGQELYQGAIWQIGTSWINTGVGVMITVAAPLQLVPRVTRNIKLRLRVCRVLTSEEFKDSLSELLPLAANYPKIHKLRWLYFTGVEAVVLCRLGLLIDFTAGDVPPKGIWHRRQEIDGGKNSKTIEAQGDIRHPVFSL